MYAVKELSPHLFWDVNRSTISLEKHQSWLVKRVLEKGTLEDWNALKDLLTKKQIIDVVKNLRSLEKKAASYACVAFKIEPKELRCFTENQSLSRHWNY